MARERARRSTMESIMTQSSQDTNINSQWEELMRQFSVDCKINMCRVNEGIIKKSAQERTSAEALETGREKLPLRQFITGSTYDGTWDAIGMNGRGVYTFPNGVVYEGDFEDGEFHGAGELRYPDGIKILGLWWRGTLKHRTLVFNDGVKHKDHDWQYCTGPDRRFGIEYENGLKAAEAKDRYLTADQPTKPVPEGRYDTCDGIYDPQTGSVFNYTDPTEVVRSVFKNQHDWIVDNCRTNPDPSGPNPELYEGQPGPMLTLPVPATPPALLSPAKSTESSLDSLEKSSDIGAVWTKILSKTSAPTKYWSNRRVIQFEPHDVPPNGTIQEGTSLE